MILTVDEAKQLWCPLSAADDGYEGGYPCIGNGCMLWRWLDSDKVSTIIELCAECKNPVGEPAMAKHPPCPNDSSVKCDGIYKYKDILNENRRGYCGFTKEPGWE